MSATQVQAAKVLLAKAVPDLKAIEHGLDEGTRAAFMLYVPEKQ